MRVALGVISVVAPTAIATACAGSDDKEASEPPCRGLPKLQGAQAQPGMPKPVSPEGVVSDYEAEYWAPGDTDTADGLCVISNSAKGTFALTGVVQRRPGRPIPQARVTLESLVLGAPRVHAETVTDVDGAFAFVDMPATANAACYRTSVVARGFGRYVLISDVGPGQQYQQTIELTRAPQRYTDYGNARRCGLTQ